MCPFCVAERLRRFRRALIRCCFLIWFVAIYFVDEREKQTDFLLNIFDFRLATRYHLIFSLCICLELYAVVCYCCCCCFIDNFSFSRSILRCTTGESIHKKVNGWKREREWMNEEVGEVEKISRQRKREEPIGKLEIIRRKCKTN